MRMSEDASVTVQNDDAVSSNCRNTFKPAETRPSTRPTSQSLPAIAVNHLPCLCSFLLSIKHVFCTIEDKLGMIRGPRVELWTQLDLAAWGESHSPEHV